ncbi:hypothetical protein Pint_05497 [Pistacia integerrima]|uniref:Uncharacterized protein n=1 Tax=Pistacia integerrima TaxID=434235 RepID=A0ACC0Z8F0_9ROSI|nr:hypothetical protein Pint_05497 [Pistacia integerrima]
MAVITRFLLGSINALLGIVMAYATEVMRGEHQALRLSADSSWAYQWVIFWLRFPYFLPCFVISLIALGVTMASCWLPVHNLFRDFHISKREEDKGYYAGYVGSSFMLCRALTSGEKLLTDMAENLVIFNTLFGLSIHFWMAIITRFLLGSLNGLLGPIKVSTTWGIGLIIGPTIIGFLAQETLHMHNDESNISCNVSYDALESASYESNSEFEKQGERIKASSSKKSLMKNWPLMSSIFVYCLFSLHDMTYIEAVSPRKYRGLNYSTEDVGEVLAITGLKCILILIYNRFIPLLTSCTYIAMLSGFTFAFSLNCASLTKNILSVSITTGLFLLQNRAVDQDQRGAANGIATTAMSLFKPVGPIGGGAVEVS